MYYINTMKETQSKNKIKCEFGGYILPTSIDQHLGTLVHSDRMRYPNGFKYETTDKLTYVVIYDKCATMEENIEVSRTYPNTTSVCSYLKYIRDRNTNRVARVYELSEN